jgi:hypothetical protein
VSNKLTEIQCVYTYMCTINDAEPVSMFERSKPSTAFGRSNIEIAGSNPARGMDVCLRLSVLCCPV